MNKIKNKRIIKMKMSDYTLEDLEKEVLRRKENQKMTDLSNLTDEQIRIKKEFKEQEDFDNLYSSMFPNETAEEVLLYPSIKNERVKLVQQTLRNRNDNIPVIDKVYPSMAGGK